MWQFRGSPHYIDQQGKRLGVSSYIIDRAHHNPEISRVSALMRRLVEQYHSSRKDGETAVVLDCESAQVRGTLTQLAQEREKLHVLAAAADAMIDEAHRAFGLEPPERHFGIYCDFDSEPATPAKAR